MKCPHCLHAITPPINENTIIQNHNSIRWLVNDFICPNCDNEVLFLVKKERLGSVFVDSESRYIYPKLAQNQPLPVEVEDFVVINDYNEAGLVLADSPKSSAALTRRCLQYILCNKINTASKDLADQIQEVIDNKILPSEISDGLDAVRNIGNFAAHTQKSIATGEIVDVEPHEAEWNMEILFDLIDYVYVRPKRFMQKKEGFNEKLRAVGKTEM